MEINLFLEDCKRCGIHLENENGELHYRAPKGVLTNDILMILKKRKTEILDLLKPEVGLDAQFKLKSTSINRALLFNQVIWKDYSTRKMDICCANACNTVIRNTGDIRPDAIMKSIKILLERHKVLNSAIEISGGNLYLVHRPQMPPAFQEIVVEGDNIESREKEAMKLANEFVWKEYDLDTGPLYRVFFIRISGADYILGAGIHHAIGDAISIGILFNELHILYKSIISNMPSPLHPLRLRFMDYLSCMETWLATPAADGHLQYWIDAFKSTPMTGLLPKDRMPKVCSNPSGGGKAIIEIDSVAVHGLRNLASKFKTTLFAILLAIHKAALWLLTEQDESVIVVINAGRINSDIQPMIGNFASEIGYKTDLSGNPSFPEIIDRLNDTMNEATSHQPIPFDSIRHKLLNIGVYFSAPTMGFFPGKEPPTPNSGPRRLMFRPPTAPDGDLPITYGIYFRERPDGIVGEMMYNKDLYDESTVNDFIRYFKDTADILINNPQKKLKELSSSV